MGKKRYSPEIFPVELESGLGYLLTREISYVVPVGGTGKSQEEWCCVKVDSMDSPLMVKGSALLLGLRWSDHLSAMEAGEVIMVPASAEESAKMSRAGVASAWTIISSG